MPGRVGFLTLPGAPSHPRPAPLAGALTQNVTVVLEAPRETALGLGDLVLVRVRDMLAPPVLLSLAAHARRQVQMGGWPSHSCTFRCCPWLPSVAVLQNPSANQPSHYRSLCFTATSLSMTAGVSRRSPSPFPDMVLKAPPPPSPGPCVSEEKTCLGLTLEPLKAILSSAREGTRSDPNASVGIVLVCYLTLCGSCLLPTYRVR